MACRRVDLAVKFVSLQPRRRGSRGRGWPEYMSDRFGRSRETPNHSPGWTLPYLQLAARGGKEWRKDEMIFDGGDQTENDGSEYYNPEDKSGRFSRQQ